MQLVTLEKSLPGPGPVFPSAPLQLQTNEWQLEALLILSPPCTTRSGALRGTGLGSREGLSSLGAAVSTAGPGQESTALSLSLHCQRLQNSPVHL